MRLGAKVQLYGLGVVVLAAASTGSLLQHSGRTSDPGPIATALIADQRREASSHAPVGSAATLPETAPPTTSVAAPPATAPPPPPPAPPTSVAPRVASRATPPKTLRSLPPGADGTWAVVMGVDDYGGRGDLTAGVADAEEVVATLRAAGVPAANIVLLRNREVTPQSVLAAADWLVDRTGPEALAVFAWAGHIRAVSPNTEALVTPDGSLVTDAAVARRLEQLRARRSWFLIAGCYGGGFTEILGPGRLLTAASDEQEQAYENSFLGHSYLVEYVVRRGLRHREGPRVVSGSVSWAQVKIRREHPGREPVSYVSGPVEPFVLGPDPTPTPAEAHAAS